MTFQDQAHVDRIRDALWRRHPIGNAAIMVGAGFSLNAKPASVSSRAMPTWKEVAQCICDHLYPSDIILVNQRSAAPEQAVATSGFIRLAQEFEVAFGRSALDNFIRDLIPDNDYEPGDLHVFLLELPWSDVFTTNWDTFLERARRDVFGRNYDVIRTMSEIPASTRPRIIKLHGSLPAHGPFIFTEEDYRTYPSRFAPFVNLVQQSMMENVFCLVGFSGDDPNFLNWTGWVRDNLGSSAPKIYLAGWLDLSPHRRRMLEDRNVVPIDLARLPQARDWPQHHRYRYAIEWFIWNLRRGEPYRSSNWPSTAPQDDHLVSSYLGQIPSARDKRPREEPSLPSSSSASDEQRLEDLREAVSVWQDNRMLYPGWVIAPYSARSLIWHHTEQWAEEFLKLSPKLMPWERLSYLRELVWRFDVCLVPLTREIASAIKCCLLVNIYPDANPDKRWCRNDDGEEITWRNADWISARKNWIELAIAALRYRRETGDHKEFEQWANRLSPFLRDRMDIPSVINHERCLLALSRLDYKTLDQVLGEWALEDIDLSWTLRKAAILAEIGRFEEAYSLARDTLEEIRHRTRRDIDDIALLSREAWAMYFLLGFDTGRPRLGGTCRYERGENWFSRWEALSIYKCNAWDELDRLRSKLEKDPPSLPIRTEELGFDLGTHNVVLHSYLKGRNWSRLLPAYQFKRLTEVAGIPPRVNHTNLAQSSLSRVAAWLAEEDPQTAMPLILRICSSVNDKVFNQFFARNRIALLRENEVLNLAEILEAAAGYFVQRSSASEREDHWISRLGFTIEFLSRLVLRLSTEEAEKVLNRAIDFYRAELFRSEPWLIDPLDHLLKRSLEAIQPLRRKAFILPIASLPLLGVDGFKLRVDRWPKPWPEPINDLNLCTVALVRPPSRSEWDDVIQRLISGVLTLLPTRSRAIQRLLKLHEWELLTAEEKAHFAAALWHQNHLSPCGLPNNTGLHDWVVLILPEPESGYAEDRFRNAYLSPKGIRYRESQFSDYVYQIGTAIAECRKVDRLFALGEAEEKLVLEKIRLWATQRDDVAPRQPFDEDSFLETVRMTIRGLMAVLPFLHPTAEDTDTILQKVDALEEAGHPVYYLYPVLLKLRPSLYEKFSFRLRLGLACDDERLSIPALEGLRLWLQDGEFLGIAPPTDDLIREIGVAISVRRASNLWKALHVAEWLFTNQPKVAQQFIADSAEHGLSYLLEEARYERGQHSRMTSASDIPLVRRQCVKLALAMSSAGIGDHQVIQRWIEDGQGDPLPEVRYLLVDVSSNQMEKDPSFE